MCRNQMQFISLNEMMNLTFKKGIVVKKNFLSHQTNVKIQNMPGVFTYEHHNKYACTFTANYYF